MGIDLEAIEAALVALDEMRAAHDADPDDIERGIVLTYAEGQVLRRDGPDLLRLVRAMRWLVDTNGSVECEDARRWCAVDWNVEVKQCGDSPIAAIESAMKTSK